MLSLMFRRAGAHAVALLACWCGASAWAQPGTTTRVSEGFVQGSGDSGACAVSADGRFVAFSSAASNLVAGDTNGEADVFLHDRVACRTIRVSVGPGGAQAGGASDFPCISADGRYVGFRSGAANLVAGDTNGEFDVFVHDVQTGTTTRVSVGAGGGEANLSSASSSISGDGRFVAFRSLATNLVAGDTNGQWDVFVRDRQAGMTTRASVGAGGAQANDASLEPAISEDGRFVAFESVATNLVAGDTNGAADVFVRDLQAGTTARVSVGPGGAQSNNPGVFSVPPPSISADGRFVAFQNAASNLVAGDTNNNVDIFVHDRMLGLTTRVSVGGGGAQANNASVSPWISADGRHVAFASLASDLVAGDTNNQQDIFVHDRQTGVTTRVNLGPGGAQAIGGSLTGARATRLSADGGVVAYSSNQTNLVAGDTNIAADIFVRDLAAGVTSIASVSSEGGQGNGDSAFAALSEDGRFAAFQSSATTLVPGDTNGVRDVFVHDRAACATTRVSVGAAGVQANADCGAPAITGDGRVVAFVSTASNLVAGDTNGSTDVFLHDRQTGVTTRASLTSGGAQATGGPSFEPFITPDGLFVAFASTATNLVAGDTNAVADVFVRNVQSGVTTRASVGAGGVQGNGASFGPAASTDGRFVAFYSDATNLVAGDTNATTDVFVRDLLLGVTTRVSVGGAGAQGTGSSFDPALSADGRYVAFWSTAANLVVGDTNSANDVFVHDRQTGTTTRVSVGSGGVQGFLGSVLPAISADGRIVAFESFASNLVAGDTNAAADVFVHDRQSGVTKRASVSSAGAQANAASSAAALSADGRFVAFHSAASGLVAGDTNGVLDVFVHERPVCAGDLSGDGVVGAADLAGILGAWGPASPGEPADLNGDGVVNAADLAAVLGAWGACP